jgi:four helix bundle protein
MSFEAHKGLDVWNNGIELVKEIYKLTAKFPKEEIYSLASQMRRPAVSVPSNLAEGTARRNDKGSIQFLYIALGSRSEPDTQLHIAAQVGYLNSNDTTSVTKLLDNVSKLISGLIRIRKISPKK